MTARHGVCKARALCIATDSGRQGGSDEGMQHERGYFAAFICLTTSSTLIEPAGKRVIDHLREDFLRLALHHLDRRAEIIDVAFVGLRQVA